MSGSHKDDRTRMRGLLEDPSLLDRAVVVRTVEATSDTGRCTWLAVPVGGSRRAGELTLANWGEALTALITLGEHPGFPNLRKAHPFGPPDHPQTVRWGTPAAPRSESAERRRTFGYTDAAAAASTDEYTAAT